MEILKEGKIDNRWVGKCRECESIIMADVREIPVPSKLDTDNNNDYSRGNCPHCNGISTVFFMRRNSPRLKKILREANINPLTLKENRP